MGTLSTFDFEGANGASISEANVSLSGTGTAVYDTADKIVGGSSGSFTTTTAQVRLARCTLAASSLTYGFDVLFKTHSVKPATGAYTVFAPRHAAGYVGTGVAWTAAGQLVYITSGNTDLLSPATTDVIPVSTWVRVQLRLVVATTTTGTINAETYLWNGTAWVQQGSTFTFTARNLGTAAITAFDVGMISAVTGVTIKADCIRGEDGRTTAFGALPTPSAPTVTITCTNQYPGPTDTVTMGSTGSTFTGTAAYAWSGVNQSGGANPAFATPSAASTTMTTSPGRNLITLAITASGQTTSSTLMVYTHPASNVNCGFYDVTPGLWTNEGGAPSYAAALNDGLDTTTLESPDSPTSAQFTWWHGNPAGPGPIAGDWSAFFKVGTVQANVALYKEDQTTQLGSTETWTPTSTATPHPITFDTSTIPDTDLSNRRALKFKVWGS